MATTAPVNPLYLASLHFRLHDYTSCINICDNILSANPLDQAAWLLKCKTLTRTRYVDDADLEEQGMAEAMMDDNNTQPNARPGTSLNNANATDAAMSVSVRPVSSRGFARPSTSSVQAGKPVSRSGPRPMTSLGRHVRLGTGSMVSGTDAFIDVSRLQADRVAKKRGIRRAVCDYLIYFERDPQKALEVAAASRNDGASKSEDWWWHSRLGKCYYLLGLLRDAERELEESLKLEKHLETVMDLGKVYLRLDQPQKALAVYDDALEALPANGDLLLAMARVKDAVSGVNLANAAYRKVLNVNPMSVEAIASLAANFFYAGQQEMALRFYQRLVQMGELSPELWNNIAICSFYAAQYDITLKCFHNALGVGDDLVAADVMYNVGVVGVSIGDLGLALHSFRVAISLNVDHAEAHNNLGILLLRQQKTAEAVRSFKRSQSCSTQVYEAFYNGALVAFKQGEIESSYSLATEASRIYGDHKETQELLQDLRKRLA